MFERHSRYGTAVLSLAMTMAYAPPSTTAAEPHPRKVAFADQETWPHTSPGEVTLEAFEPFHAVYDRAYTQASGSGAGEARKDRVIVHADEVAWDGRRAVAITVIDSAVAEHADTNMRGLMMVAALDDLSILFEIGPSPGKAKDYYVGLVTETDLLLSNIDTSGQKLQAQKIPTRAPGFGPGSWVMASMKLERDMKIRLAPYYSPQANPISQTSFGRVLDRESVTDGSGTQHEAWVVEAPGWYGVDHPKVLRLYLKSTPPYYLGTETYNYDSGERSRFVWLRHTQPSGG